MIETNKFDDNEFEMMSIKLFRFEEGKVQFGDIKTYFNDFKIAILLLLLAHLKIYFY